MIALAALVVGGGVSAAMLVTADPSRGAVEAYVADVQARAFPTEAHSFAMSPEEEAQLPNL